MLSLFAIILGGAAAAAVTSASPTNLTASPANATASASDAAWVSDAAWADDAAWPDNATWAADLTWRNGTASTPLNRAEAAWGIELIVNTRCHDVHKTCKSRGRIYPNLREDPPGKYYYLDANEGCRSPDSPPGTERFCMDWKRNRGHIVFIEHGTQYRTKVCFSMVDDVHVGSDYMHNSWDSTWKSVYCTW